MTSPKLRIVITGGPGFGKTTVLTGLQHEGYLCIPDAPRQILEEESGKENGIHPKDNFEGFAMLVLDRMVEQYLESDGNNINFFDRGMPDILAYMNYAGIQIAPTIRQKVEHYPYHPVAFFFPPWPEIYDTDAVRYESLAQAQMISQHLRDTYEKLGYNLIDVPKKDVKERIDFIKEHLPLP
jgi:predicted ATPase